MKFSIIIPIYNSEKYISKCIESVLNQTYSNFELLLIDDGSTDKSMEIINKYKNDPRVKVFSKKNSGVSDTRNFGLDNISGEWVTFVDSDDWIELNTLSLIKEYISNDKDVDIIHTNLIFNYPNNKIAYGNINKDIYPSKELLIESIISLKYFTKKEKKLFGNTRCIGGKFYKSSLIKEYRFDKLLQVFEDGIFNLGLCSAANKVLISKKTIYHYRQHLGSITQKYNPEQNEQNELILKRIKPYITKNIINSYYYCYFDLQLVIINQLAEKFNLIEYYKKYKKINFKREYLKSIKYKYLSFRDKIAYFLIKYNFKLLLYIMYRIKKIIKKWR